MVLPASTTAETFGPLPTNASRADANAVSWGAILAGATAAASLSLILLILGTGLGLSSVSPWAYSGIGAATFGISTILWVSVSQVLASGMGGYLAGRLRGRWLTVHNDEVYFRDTAHGFLAWAVASLVTATLLTSMIGTILSAGVQSMPAITKLESESKPISEPASGPINYFVDMLFRKELTATPTTNSRAANSLLLAASGEKANAAPLAEVSRIFINTMHTGPLPAEDVRYLGQLVAQRTGLTQQAAETRVNYIYLHLQTQLQMTATTAKEAADKARKASAYAALWLFISLICGAFVASYAATFGGQRRDA